MEMISTPKLSGIVVLAAERAVCREAHVRKGFCELLRELMDTYRPELHYM